jgi:hypothetical protein
VDNYWGVAAGAVSMLVNSTEGDGVGVGTVGAKRLRVGASTPNIEMIISMAMNIVNARFISVL